MAQKKTNKTVIAMSDTSLSYITLQKNAEGYDVVDYAETSLPKGVVERGEILKAEFLTKALEKIKQKISYPVVDVIIPHEYFTCKNIPLVKTQKKLSLKDRVLHYFTQQDSSEEWQQTHVCEFSETSANGKDDTALLRCLPQDMYRSYDYVLTQAGLTMQAISSEILTYDHVILGDRVLLISLQEKYCLVAEFKNGIYTSLKKFQVSYDQFKQDIKRNVSIGELEAEKILKKYGILRTHKDEKVYRRLLQSMSPLLDYISKRKTSDQYTIWVTFNEKPIAGFVDIIAQASGAESQELDIIKTEYYPFTDVLSLHRNESYRFAPLIAQALKMWKKK